MRFFIFAIFLLLASCASNKKALRGVTFEELNNRLAENFEQKFNCGEFSKYKFVTKLEFIVCLSILVPKRRQSVRLDYNDLPKSGPIVDHVFHLISVGAVRPKSQFEFGSQDFVQEKEIELAMQVLKQGE